MEKIKEHGDGKKLQNYYYEYSISFNALSASSFIRAEMRLDEV
jgi:hypothetical protein